MAIVLDLFTLTILHLGAAFLQFTRGAEPKKAAEAGLMCAHSRF